MKVIKKYTAIQMGSETVNNEVMVKLSYGDITGPYYDRSKPTEEFDTEEEAIKYAHGENNYGKWLILPIVRFEN